MAVPFEAKKLCSYSLKPSDIEAFQRAIDEEYYFEFIYGPNRLNIHPNRQSNDSFVQQTTSRSGDLLVRRKCSAEMEKKEQTIICSPITSSP
jgi:hypothetical protein